MAALMLMIPTFSTPESLLEGDNREALELLLPEFLQRQRWFGGKARPLNAVHIADWGVLTEAPRLVYLVMTQVDYHDGGADHYLLPLTALIEPDKPPDASMPMVLSPISSWEGPGVLCDALVDDAACAALLALIGDQREIPTRCGRVCGMATREYRRLRGYPASVLPIHRTPTEQSNTNIRFGDRLLLKVLRRLEPGPNPDFEISRFLTERTSFRRVPPLAGGIEYHCPGQEPVTLALLQGLAPSQCDGWTFTLSHLRQCFEQVARNQDASKLSAGYLGAVELLAKRTAELHLALASDSENPAFRPEPLTPADLQAVLARIRAHVQRTCQLLEENRAPLPESLQESIRLLLSQREPLSQRLEGPPPKIDAAKIRVHGDYHLGQVLWTGDNFYLLDFEGEPTRPLAERRAKHSPLKDVAGMLRSFDYAAHAALSEFTRDQVRTDSKLEDWATQWRASVSDAFLKSWQTAAAGASFLPTDSNQFRALLELFLLDKALYELDYELNNRPDWVGIPLRGVLSLLTTTTSPER